MDNETSETQGFPEKRSIIKFDEYNLINDFIKQHKGLAIDCETDLLNCFPQIEILTLKFILEWSFINRARSYHSNYDANAENYYKMYEQLSKKSPNIFNPCIILDIARSKGIGPVVLCRVLLKFKYNEKSKNELNNMIRSPQTIDDPQLAANVIQCICSDSQNGPLIDVRRRILGEEYEFKLKQMATAAGLHYYDEKDLIRLGYDKTPDIKMILPFLYKGKIINWIESKAYFANKKVHNTFINQQLNSYCNRFGSGIIIYWFGYVDGINIMSDNNIGIVVLNDFPALEDIQIIDLSDSSNLYDHTSLLLDDNDDDVDDDHHQISPKEKT